MARCLQITFSAFKLAVAEARHWAGSAAPDDAFAARVADHAPRAQIVSLREQAVIGAARLALELLESPAQ